MEYAKKMALVEPRLLENLQAQQQISHMPMVKAMSFLDQDMEEVLSRHDLGTDEKVKRYNQVLQRYVNYEDKRKGMEQAPIQMQMVGSPPATAAPHESVMTPDPIEEEVLGSVPKTMKKKAELLLQRMKTSPSMQWTEKGELVYKDKVVPNTNVADLVNDALRRRKRFEPHGWQTFARALKETNVPQDLIGHEERWKWMQNPPREVQDKQKLKIKPKQKTKTRVVSTRVPRWSPY